MLGTWVGVANVSLLTRASGGMADALASGASEGNLVGVQVPPRPHEDPSSAGVLSRSGRLSPTGLLPECAAPRDKRQPQCLMRAHCPAKRSLGKATRTHAAEAGTTALDVTFESATTWKTEGSEPEPSRLGRRRRGGTGRAEASRRRTMLQRDAQRWPAEPRGSTVRRNGGVVP